MKKRCIFVSLIAIAVVMLFTITAMAEETVSDGVTEAVKEVITELPEVTAPAVAVTENQENDSKANDYPDGYVVDGSEDDPDAVWEPLEPAVEPDTDGNDYPPGYVVDGPEDNPNAVWEPLEPVVDDDSNYPSGYIVDGPEDDPNAVWEPLDTVNDMLNVAEIVRSGKSLHITNVRFATEEQALEFLTFITDGIEIESLTFVSDETGAIVEIFVNDSSVLDVDIDDEEDNDSNYVVASNPSVSTVSVEEDAVEAVTEETEDAPVVTSTQPEIKAVEVEDTDKELPIPEEKVCLEGVLTEKNQYTASSEEEDDNEN